MRKLKLRREPLAELGAGDLARVAGGEHSQDCPPCPTWHDRTTCLGRPEIHSIDVRCTV